MNRLNKNPANPDFDPEEQKVARFLYEIKWLWKAGPLPQENSDLEDLRKKRALLFKMKAMEIFLRIIGGF